MELRIFGADDIRRALPMRAAIDAVRPAFESLSGGRATVPVRLSLPLPGTSGTGGSGHLLVKPAVLPWAVGAKLVSVVPGNRDRGIPTTSGLAIAIDPVTGVPSAILDGTFLTAWRTAATAALAIETLTPDPTRVALIGAGGLAEALVPALDAIDGVVDIRVYARDRCRLAAFVKRAETTASTSVQAAPTAASCVEGCDVVVTATTSETPVVSDAALESARVICALGSFRPTMREIEVATVARSRVVVDTREGAEAEAGELVAAIAVGATDPATWVTLGDLLVGNADATGSGGVTPDTGTDDRWALTLFDSVGTAAQDVAVAAAVLASGTGRTVSL